MTELQKWLISLGMIVVIAVFQLCAWYMGQNGTVENFTMVVIGAIIGALFGVSVNIKSSIANYIKQKGKQG